MKKTYLQVESSDGILQQSSHSFDGGSFGPCLHWHDSRPYAMQIDPVHSCRTKKQRVKKMSAGPEMKMEKRERRKRVSEKEEK